MSLHENGPAVDTNRDPWTGRPFVTPNREMPKQVTRFKKGRPHKFYYVTSYGDSGYCHSEEALAEMVELYTSRDRDVAVYELRPKLHKHKKGSK